MNELAETDTRYKQARRVTLIGSVIDVVLGVTKVVTGTIFTSQALVADGIHSLSDLVTDFMVLIAMKEGSRDADDEHPYGHGRFETLASLTLGLLLIVVALGIAQQAAETFFSSEPPVTPGWPTLLVALLSVVSKEWIFRYTMVVAERLDSQLLKANAWHSRTDAISSLIVIAGIVGAMAGMYYLDALAAIGVAGVIAKVGWDLSATGVRELVDTGIDQESLEEIRQTIIDTKGVEDLHLLRTRRMGSEILVDVHIIVDSMLTVSEGHWIGEEVRHRIQAQHPEVRDITVHCDPEDDEVAPATDGLPERDDVMDILKRSWSGFEEAGQVEKINLHYLDGSLHVEVVLPMALATTPERMQELVDKFSSSSFAAAPEVKNIRVMFAS